MNGVPLNINLQQILLHLLNFAILFAALYFLLYKPVKKFMDKREQTYKDMDEKAKQNLAESEEIKNEYAKKFADVDDEISKIKEEARVAMDKQREETIQAATEEASKIISKAKSDAEKEKETIISSAQTEITEIVKDAAEKLAFGASEEEVMDKFLASERGKTNE